MKAKTEFLPQVRFKGFIKGPNRWSGPFCELFLISWLNITGGSFFRNFPSKIIETWPFSYASHDSAEEEG